MLLEVWGFCWLYYSWKSYLTDNGVGERGKWILWFSICSLKMYFQQKRQQYGCAFCHAIWAWLCRRVVHFSKRIYYKIQKGTFWKGKWVAYKTFAHFKHVRYYCGMKFHGTDKGKVFSSHAWNNMEEWRCSFTHFQPRRLRTPAALSPWKELWVPIVKKTGCPQGWYGRFGEEISPYSCWDSNHYYSDLYLVAWSLYQLRYSGCLKMSATLLGTWTRFSKIEGFMFAVQNGLIQRRTTEEVLTSSC